jgi:hypothetical protein
LGPEPEPEFNSNEQKFLLLASSRPLLPAARACSSSTNNDPRDLIQLGTILFHNDKNTWRESAPVCALMNDIRRADALYST